MTSESAVVIEDYEDEQEQLYVVSFARRWQTRSQRRRPGGKRPRFNLILCGGKIRLLRGKSRPLPIGLFHQYQHDLVMKMRAGQIDIRVGGPNGSSIGLSWDDEFMEVPCDDGSEKDAQAESTASLESSESGPEAPEGTDEPPDQEEVEAPTSDESGVLETDDVGDELEAEEEIGESIPEPPKPLERMNKVELIDYCVQLTGMKADDLEPMVKREILEAIQGALA